MNFSNLKKTYLMGILNITPDSFYDGGKYFNLSSALKHAEKLISEGADIVDIGGESTRPGSKPISSEEELSRVIPVIKELKKNFPQTVVSIDSYKYEVVKQALENGVEIVNDIYALKYSPKIVSLLKQFINVKIILMHMQNNPTTMQTRPYYDNLISEIKDFFTERIDYLKSKHIDKTRIILDPGIGFGKTTKHNLEILKNLSEFKFINGNQFPLLIGLSRKSFIGKILGSEENPLAPEDRYEGGIILHTYVMLKKVNIIRTHDVKHISYAKKILKHL